MPVGERTGATGFNAFTGRATIAILVVLGLVVLVAVIGTQSPSSRNSAVPVSDRVSVAIPLDASEITGLDVASIGVATWARRGTHPWRSDSPPTEVTDLGLREDNSLDVPSDAATVGWYDRSSSPGTVGPAVMAGHVNYSGEDGTFAKLKDVKKDDTVEAHRKDGTTAVFRVDEVGQYDKDAFPTDTVYGPTSDAEIRLITCGGVFNSAKRSYDDNIVVFGRIVDAYRARDA